MQDPEDLTAALQRLQLSPPKSTARDIWYRAGLEAGRRRVNTWRGVAALTTLLGSLALTQTHRDSSPMLTGVPYVKQNSLPAAPPTVDATPADKSSAAYARLLNAIAMEGLNGLPPVDMSTGSGTPPPRGHAHEDFDADLGIPAVVQPITSRG